MASFGLLWLEVDPIGQRQISMNETRLMYCRSSKLATECVIQSIQFCLPISLAITFERSAATVGSKIIQTPPLPVQFLLCIPCKPISGSRNYICLSYSDSQAKHNVKQTEQHVNINLCGFWLRLRPSQTRLCFPEMIK